MHVKRFLEWIGLKENLHIREQKVPHVNQGEVWWASLGENIGFEINGKSSLFTRPVLVFKKLSKEFFLVVPLTTQKHSGSWYVSYTHQGRAVTACLQQIRTIDYRRLSTKLGVLDDADFQRVYHGFESLYLRKIFPAISDGAVGKSQK